MFTCFALVSIVLNEVPFSSLGFSGVCSEPKAMKNAVRTVANRKHKAGTRITSILDTEYETGTEVTYTCDQCFKGGGISTCQCNGEWSAVPDVAVVSTGHRVKNITNHILSLTIESNSSLVCDQLN